jgi:hypothetical protein
VITPEEFDALFDSFRHTVHRLEALPAYAVGGSEAERIRAFEHGLARPEQSVRTSPWLARIARSTLVDGKQWSRTRVVDTPLTDYQRYQIDNWRETQAVGSKTLIARRADVGDVGPDFWLFDASTSAAFAVIMRYDKAGHWLGAEHTDDPTVIADLVAVQAAVDAHAIPLNEFLVRLAAVTHGS